LRVADDCAVIAVPAGIAATFPAVSSKVPHPTRSPDADQTGPKHKIQNIAKIGFLNIVVLLQKCGTSMLSRHTRAPEMLAALRL
jgi:hypothetical protein